LVRKVPTNQKGTLMDMTVVTKLSFPEIRGSAPGKGVEVPVAHNWKVRAEYLYIDLGSQTIAFSPQPLLSVGVSSAYRENIFRVGANYAFDWSLPTVAVAAR
jgi:outer membrane immunogenic protein